MRSLKNAGIVEVSRPMSRRGHIRVHVNHVKSLEVKGRMRVRTVVRSTVQYCSNCTVYLLRRGTANVERVRDGRGSGVIPQTVKKRGERKRTKNKFGTLHTIKGRERFCFPLIPSAYSFSRNYCTFPMPMQCYRKVVSTGRAHRQTISDKLTKNAWSRAIMNKIYPTLQSHPPPSPQVLHSAPKRLRGSLVIT